jgi:hypothetical protein
MLQGFSYLPDSTPQQLFECWIVACGILVNFKFLVDILGVLKSICLFWVNFEYRYFFKLIELYRTAYPNDCILKIIPRCFINAKLAKTDKESVNFYNRLLRQWLPKKTTTKPVSRGDYHDAH